MNGYPYQRLADPRRNPTPTPQSVGEMLVNRSGGGQPSPMAEAMVGGMPPSAGAMGPPAAPGGMPQPMGAPMGGMPAAGPGMAEPGMGAMPMAAPARIPALGMEGDYDPVTEHSPSSTRVALDYAVRAAMGRMPGSERRVAPSNSREQLTRLGIPPLEVDLMMRSGQLGDPEE